MYFYVLPRVWTLHCSTWSEHQYHMEGMDMPMMTPGQGRSEVTGCLNMWKASERGIPQVEFGTRIAGMALAYPSIRAFQPPTSTKPGTRRVTQTGGWSTDDVNKGLTEAHEGQRASQHNGSLSSVCVDDGSQTACNTNKQQTVSSSSMETVASYKKWKSHLLQCRELWLRAAAPRRGRCSTVRPAGWTLPLHTCPPGHIHTQCKYN